MKNVFNAWTIGSIIVGIVMCVTLISGAIADRQYSFDNALWVLGIEAIVLGVFLSNANRANNNNKTDANS